MTKKIVKIVFDESLQPVEIDFEKCKQCLTVVNMFNGKNILTNCNFF